MPAIPGIIFFYELYYNKADIYINNYIYFISTDQLSTTFNAKCQEIGSKSNIEILDEHRTRVPERQVIPKKNWRKG